MRTSFADSAATYRYGPLVLFWTVGDSAVRCVVGLELAADCAPPPAREEEHPAKSADVNVIHKTAVFIVFTSECWRASWNSSGSSCRTFGETRSAARCGGSLTVLASMQRKGYAVPPSSGGLGYPLD